MLASVRSEVRIISRLDQYWIFFKKTFVREVLDSVQQALEPLCRIANSDKYQSLAPFVPLDERSTVNTLGEKSPKWFPLVEKTVCQVIHDASCQRWLNYTGECLDKNCRDAKQLAYQCK